MCWRDLLCYFGDLMWCIIRGSFSKHICQEFAGLLAGRWVCRWIWRRSPNSHYFPSDDSLPTTWFSPPPPPPPKPPIDTWAWIYLHYTENNLVEVSVKTEHRGALTRRSQWEDIPDTHTLQFPWVICYSYWSINGPCPWCSGPVSLLWIPH